MANSISIEVQDAELKKALEQLQKQSGNVGDAMQVIGSKLLSRVQLGFRAGRSPYGEPWLPLKSRVGQPLRDTKRLQNSMTYRVGKDGSSAYVDVGTNTSYAPIHQFGATVNVPARTQTIYKSLTRSGDYRKGGQFVKASKSNFAQSVNVPAYKIVIPARPFLPIKNNEINLPLAWEKDALALLAAHFNIGGA